MSSGKKYEPEKKKRENVTENGRKCKGERKKKLRGNTSYRVK
jgi:hypothetical protein